MRVHTALPEALTEAVQAVLEAEAVEHVAHRGAQSLRAAEAAAADPDALALIGPYRSAEIAEAVEATAPVGLPLLAPVATWAGVTRDDEPGCEDAARHRGTVLRMVARDTVVAARLARHVRAAGRHAVVVAGDHDYGRQLDGQLRLGGLPRSDDGEGGDLVVLAGLARGPEVARAAALAPLPLVAFDGVQGADLGADRDVRLALPFAPDDGRAGVEQARHAAELLVAALRQGARDRPSLLGALRELGPFDEHGDPVDPPVWLWRASADWTLVAHVAI
ncbi:MAG: hypothetical protein E6G10_20070 [Actinobacteria bacterium]|nr:MAG: hypothetical protein E6G10_20070 [Actinomycetota bacterium]